MIRSSNKPLSELLQRQNLDEAALLALARKIASACGLPEATPFCDFHPAKLFDFSTRARCVTPYRILARQVKNT